MKTTTTLVVAGAGLGLLLLAKKKADNYVEVLTQMSMNIDKIRNIRLRSGKTYFDCNVTLINNTNFDLLPKTAGLVVIKRISLISAGKTVGNAYGTISEFKLPKRGTMEIKNIEVELLSLNLIDQLLGGQLTSEGTFKLEIEIHAFGQTFILEQ